MSQANDGTSAALEAPITPALGSRFADLAERLSPVRALQRLLVLFNGWPLQPLLRGLYGLALGRVLRKLQAHPGVHSIYGTGSMFDGGGVLFGLSDVDLFIVLRDRVDRLDLDRQELGALYEAERKRFPFLGPWYEKEQSLIYLGEVRRGFPLLESFRIRHAQGRVKLLCGEAFPAELTVGFGNQHDALVEMESLLRVAATKRDVHTRNLRFWKKLFDKLLACARWMGLHELETRARARPELSFLAEPEARLFFRAARTAELFARFEALACEIFAALAQREESLERTVEVVPVAPGAIPARPPGDSPASPFSARAAR